MSAYARAGRECRHNLNYWRFGDYLGIGAGAHGKLSAAPGAADRTRPERCRYVARCGCASRVATSAGSPPCATVTPVAAAQLPFEFMLNALRLIDGVEPRLYRAHTGQPWAGIAPTVERLVRRGLLADPAAGRLQPTAQGLQFLNDLLVEFLPAETGGLSGVFSAPGSKYAQAALYRSGMRALRAISHYVAR